MQGYLKKLGVKGPRKTWSKRFFIQKPDSPNRLYYYVNENSSSPQGYINLEEGNLLSFHVFSCFSLYLFLFIFL